MCNRANVANTASPYRADWIRKDSSMITAISISFYVCVHFLKDALAAKRKEKKREKKKREKFKAVFVEAV